MRRVIRARSKWLWAALLGGAWAVSSLAHSPRLSAQIPGAPVPAPPAPAPPVVISSAAANIRARTVSQPPETVIAERDLQGQLDLTKMVLVDDHFEVTLRDGRIAVLTLDPELQRSAEQTLARAKAPAGAIVVTSTDGRILALAGRRNDGSGSDWKLSTTVWAPAASVFKLVTAAALVDSGIKPDQKVCYHGGLRSIDRSQLADDPKRDNRCNDLSFGVAHSQNAILAKLAHQHLDHNQLHEFASAFGFGQDQSCAIPVETARANLPGDPLDFSRVAAGFGSTEISPLGGALLANVVATGGISVTPRLVERVITAEGHVAKVPAGAQRRVLKATVAKGIAAMMRETCDSGTAYKAFHDRRGRSFLGDVAVAGKTGTLNRKRAKGEDYMQYSWFVGFAPAEAPEVSISVLLGNGELWHLKAHTAARMVLETAL